MTYALRTDEQGRLTLPKAVCDHLGLLADAEVEVEENGDTLRVSLVAISKADKQLAGDLQDDTKRYVGLLRQEFLAEGWTSVDEYIADMRGR